MIDEFDNGRRDPTIVVLISGSGSNLQAIIDAVAADRIRAGIAAVVSNRPDARGLDRARAAGIEAVVVDHRRFDGREPFDAALRETIDRYQPDLVVLAGFMRILTDAFVEHYHGRMLNIHPSLLPAFRGLDTHARALAAGASEHGASIHFVTSELDGGPVVAQVRVAVRGDDTPQKLATRVLTQEHRLYPLVIDWYTRGRLRLTDTGPTLDGKPLVRPCQLHADSDEVSECG